MCFRIQILLLLISSLFVTGCSSFSKPNFIQKRSKMYLSARSIPPLKIPPGISSTAFHQTYPVSDQHYPESAMDISLVPSGLNAQKK
jgi:uncharacterized lipoprotein